MEPETKTPVMDIAPPPKTENTKPDQSPADTKHEPKQEEAKAEVSSKKPKAEAEKSDQSIAGPIIMTLLVIGGLAALATYAYLKQ